jgi:hypothetical protein
VIYQGELRGVGAVADLTSQSEGRVEIIFCASRMPAAFGPLGVEAHVSGDMVSAVVQESQQDVALDILRRERLKLISLTPVRKSLEEYYMQNLRPSEIKTSEIKKGVGV